MQGLPPCGKDLMGFSSRVVLTAGSFSTRKDVATKDLPPICVCASPFFCILWMGVRVVLYVDRFVLLQQDLG